MRSYKQGTLISIGLNILKYEFLGLNGPGDKIKKYKSYLVRTAGSCQNPSAILAVPHNARY